jgi:mannose-6-phosphate isomerase-like protein (cupin superfamily)
MIRSAPTQIHSVEYAATVVEQPDGPRASARSHRRLETTIRVTDGVVYVVAGDHESILLPGDQTVVAAGESYRRWNAGDEEARYVETFRPIATDRPSVVSDLRLAVAAAAA